jgi:hypothetical protein
MPPLTDPERLRHYKHALRLWHVTGYILFTPRAQSWINRNLSGVTAREVGRLMNEYVRAGGVIDEVQERRPEYSEHEHHHDLRLRVHGREVYIETRLIMERDVDDTVIQVVNIHDP